MAPTNPGWGRAQHVEGPRIERLAADPRLVKARHRLAGLSRREASVLRLRCAGATNAQIAARYGVGEQAVKNHVVAVLRQAYGRPAPGRRQYRSITRACYWLGLMDALGEAPVDEEAAA